MTRQNSSGAFGLWAVDNDGDDLWLDAFVTDFLTRARERSFAVPAQAFDSALDHLRNEVVNAADPSEGAGEPLAYALYVLARNGRPIVGDLRYLTDVKLAVFKTPMAQAQVAAALAMLGDRARAGKVFTSALAALEAEKDNGLSRRGLWIAPARRRGGARAAGRGEFDQRRNLGRSDRTRRRRGGSGARRAELHQHAGKELARARRRSSGRTRRAQPDQRRRPADQGHVQQKMEHLCAGPKSRDVREYRHVAGARHHDGVRACRVEPEAALAQGYELERTFYKLDGTKTELTRLGQNDRVVVVLKVTEAEARYARLLVVDRLPAGLEIDNPALFDSGSLDAFSWLKRDLEPVHTEYRDDRFVAAMDREPGQSAFFTLAYVVRAVAPGRYIYPPATAEDMYRPERFGRTGFGTIEVTSK